MKIARFNDLDSRVSCDYHQTIIIIVFEELASFCLRPSSAKDANLSSATISIDYIDI